MTLELPRSAALLEIWNRGTGTCLGLIELNRSVPEITLAEPSRDDKSYVALRWRARDKEGSSLRYVVTISPDGEQWWPVSPEISASDFVLDTSKLPPGDYQVEVLALNSIRMGRSNRVRF